MPKILMILVATLLLSACGNEGAEATSNSETQATAEKIDPPANKSSTKTPKWVINIDGLPEQSGSVIVALTMGGNGRYTIAQSGFTASIAVEQENPASNMMISYNEENARCFNAGDAIVTIDGDRALLSGEVKCMPKEGENKVRTSATIEGWFELKK